MCVLDFLGFGEGNLPFDYKNSSSKTGSTLGTCWDRFGDFFLSDTVGEAAKNKLLLPFSVSSNKLLTAV
jgi:hypothetical protein